MALQTSGLKMLGLGVQNDAPPDTGQPTPLVDGVHLRWESPSERGFPRYGFYLFRRAHRGGDPRLLSVSVGTEKPTGNQLDTDLGRLTSDVNLVLRDDFPPSGAMEFDLAGRDHLRFDRPAGEPARRVELSVPMFLSAWSGRHVHPE